MTKQKLTHPDPLVMKVHKLLKTIEPRKQPTEVATNDYGHRCWVCPYCSELVRRSDRIVSRRYGQETIVGYSSYNMHFAARHGKPFWKEQQIINLLRKELQNG